MSGIESLYGQLTVPGDQRSVAISQAEGEFLHRFLVEQRLTRTLETGSAYGFSAAYIMSATRSPHYAIDPHPEAYGPYGTANVAQIGCLDFLRLERGHAHHVLPRLSSEGVRLDFGFIDGDHRFDGAFIDFYYLDLMLERCGYIVLHDAWMPSIRQVAAWVQTNRKDYRFVATGLANLIAMQRIGDDERDWRHFVNFTQRNRLVTRLVARAHELLK